MSGLPIGQFYPENSVLHRLDARAKLICFMLLLVSVVCTRNVTGYAVLCAATAAIVWASGLPVSLAAGALKRLWRFLLLVFIMNALFFGPEQAIWRWWIFSLSRQGVLQGVRVAANVALLVVLSNVLLCTTRPVETTNALSDLLRPLGIIGVPVRDVSMIITVAIRFIPTLTEEVEMIRLAQTARGAKFDSRRLLDRAKSVLPLIVPAFVSAFRRADDLAQAMEARGYRGAKGRTLYASGRLCRRDIAAMLVCGLFCFGQVILFR